MNNHRDCDNGEEHDEIKKGIREIEKGLQELKKSLERFEDAIRLEKQGIKGVEEGLKDIKEGLEKPRCGPYVYRRCVPHCPYQSYDCWCG
jgi:predicted  nucleic acid-binding Zn-ribbon protein